MLSNEQLLNSLARLRSYLVQDPENPHLLNMAADACLRSGNFDEGKEFALRALTVSPETHGARHTLALLEMVSGNVDRASELFRGLIESGISHPAIRSNLAYSLLLQGKASGIPELLRDAADCVAEAPDAPALRMRAMHILGKIGEAIEFGKDYLAKHPEDATVCALLSTLCVDNEDFEVAEKYAVQAKHLGSHVPEAWVTSGTLELARQNEVEAIRHFEEALQANPVSGRAMAGRGLAHMLALDMDKAERDLREATTLMPDHIGTWHALGWTQLLKNDLASARATFEHALSLDRNFAESHGALAIVMISEGGRLEEASQSVKRSLGLDKHCFSGLFAQSLLLNTQGHRETAKRIIEGIMNSGILPGGITMREGLLSYLQHKKTLRR